LALLAMAISCAVDLVLDLVLGRLPALITAGVLAAILAVAWAALPLIDRARHPPVNGVSQTGDVTLTHSRTQAREH
jgi:hypothetical protein